MAQRISRAKQTIKTSGRTISSPFSAGAGWTPARSSARALSDLQRGICQQHPGRICNDSILHGKRSRLTRNTKTLLPENAEAAADFWL